MNESFIKCLIKHKLKVSKSVMDHLPPELSKQIMGAGKTILEAVNEGIKEIENTPTEDTKKSSELKNVSID
ncbi:hypothetical protein MUN89_03310 [Halobacillus salinarum]|uniref:Uncharacterized protein n=1 Tax=Halobacillus salinarum TaxID=2932257 RepID=A0ABY4EKJ7_9BACI|nr:hypothetical protein [Halobacillus salinarum]UOQ44994.1 hypothetical protein MUN89_03310 [Halobacillus salinarum]